MARESGFNFIMNVTPHKGDEFIVKKLYRLVHTGVRPLVTLIEVEFYEHSICVMKFFTKGFGGEKNKYSIRVNHYGVRQVLSIFRCCLNVFISLEGDNALIFMGADDEGEVKEYNRRFSVYSRFIENNLDDYFNYKIISSIKLNTQLYFPASHPHENEVLKFYDVFLERALKDLEERKQEIESKDKKRKKRREE